MSFVDLFAADLEPPVPPAVHERPAWVGPPDGELGVAVPLLLVLGHGERGVVAVSHALAYSSGISFDLVAHVGGLEPRQASSLFHEQHAPGGDPDELPDGFLRFGLELPDGVRVSNLGGRHPWAPEVGPSGPILVQHGGGGGQSSGTSISWQLGFWLWPLPPPGTLRLYCEWPVAGVGVAGVGLDAAPLLDAAARATRIWDDGEQAGAWTRSVGQYTMSRATEVATPTPTGEAVAVPAGELWAVAEALRTALRTLRRLER